MSWELVYIVAGIAILPMFFWAVWVSIKVHIVIQRYHNVPAHSNFTGKALAEQIAQEQQLNIRIEAANDATGDHYDSRDKAVRLTNQVLNGSSLSALAITAHECGHALQDAQNYAPLRIRHLVIGVSNFSSRFLTPLIIIGFIVSLFTFGSAADIYLQWLMLAFCVIYGLSALASLITLPTEFNASRRGKQLLESMHVIESNEDRRAVNQVLRAAANTYVAAFAMSLLYLLRYLSYFMLLVGRKRD